MANTNGGTYRQAILFSDVRPPLGTQVEFPVIDIGTISTCQRVGIAVAEGRSHRFLVFSPEIGDVGTNGQPLYELPTKTQEGL